MKLGEEVMAKLKGTPLDKARELDELIVLNRGVPEGEHTDIVKQLVADAAAGKDVSAVAYRQATFGKSRPTRTDICPHGAGDLERLQAFLATIVELDMPVVWSWSAEQTIADIDHPNLTAEHLKRAAEFLHHIADALAVCETNKAANAAPVPADDGLDIPTFLRRDLQNGSAR